MGLPFPENATVADVGESGLLRILKDRFGSAPGNEVWSGDDTAVVELDRRALFTTDVLVENIDFDLSYCSGFDVGWKSLAVNVSDVAAMGGRPTRAVVALSLSADTQVAVVESLIEGFEDGGRRWGVGIVGGDISSADRMSVAVALLGEAGSSPVLRSGARAGDSICVTGTLGGARGGLFALQRGLSGHGRKVESLIERQLRPVPRLDESAALVGVGVTSMIDVSDGLALDLMRVMDASETGCDISSGLVPVDPALDALEGGPEPLELALNGGEDYELLCTIDPGSLDRATSALSSLAGLTRIGTVTEGDCTIDGEPLADKESGWDHLRSR